MDSNPLKKLILLALLLPSTGWAVSTITKDAGTATGNLTQSYVVPGNGVSITYGATNAVSFPFTNGIVKFNGAGNLVQAIAGTDYASPTGPFPWDDVTGTPTTLAGYGITNAANINGPFPWSGVTGTPVTYQGYGITNIPTSLPPNGAAGGDLSGTFPNPTVTNGSHITAIPWSVVTGTPTTLAGYGITDAASLSTNIFTGPQSYGVQNLTGSNWRILGSNGSIAFDTAHITSDGSGNLTAVSFIGNGSSLTNLGWGNIVSTPVTYQGYGITNIPTALPPNGAAGGDLSGTYPNPTATNGIHLASLPTNTALYPTLNQNTTGTASNVTGTVAIANGGTGTNAPTLIQGSNVTITGTWPFQTINATGGGGGGGTVTNFTSGNLSPLFTSSVANSTTAPALTYALSNVSSNAFLAGPTSGNAAAPTYRNIVGTDIPVLNQNTTGTASNVTGVVGVANGGNGTNAPSLIQGSNVTITGAWPFQTISATGGGSGTISNSAKFSFPYYSGSGTTNSISGVAALTNSVPVFNGSAMIASTNVPFVNNANTFTATQSFTGQVNFGGGGSISSSGEIIASGVTSGGGLSVTFGSTSLDNGNITTDGSGSITVLGSTGSVGGLTVGVSGSVGSNLQINSDEAGGGGTIELQDKITSFYGSIFGEGFTSGHNYILPDSDGIILLDTSGLNASKLITGTVPTAQLGSGSASSSTFLRGDQTWQTISGGSGTVTNASVVSTNGFAGTVANSTTAPAITLTTTVTGLPIGNGTNFTALSTVTNGIPIYTGSAWVSTNAPSVSGANIVTNSITAPSLSLTKLTSSLGSDVSITSATYFDGPSVAQGTSGTWFVSGTITLLNTLGATIFNVKLWDGTTVIASSQEESVGTVGTVSIALSGIITSPSGNLRISAEASSGTIKFNASGNSKDSTITAIRIQ